MALDARTGQTRFLYRCLSPTCEKGGWSLYGDLLIVCTQGIEAKSVPSELLAFNARTGWMRWQRCTKAEVRALQYSPEDTGIVVGVIGGVSGGIWAGDGVGEV